MNTQVIRTDPSAAKPAGIAQAAEILQKGGLVAFPTETVYGVGAHALDTAAVQRIFTAKGRPATNPIIVHVTGIEQARSLAKDWPDAADQLASRFWPGPITLVVPRAGMVPAAVTAGGATVALRSPAHPVAAALLREFGMPIAAPSANASAHISPTLAEHVWKDLAGKIELILDAGPVPGGIESTVLDVTQSPPTVLRPGLVSVEELEEILHLRIHRWACTAETGRAERSPGRLRRHYSPGVPLELVMDGGRQRVHALSQAGFRVGWMTLQATPAEQTVNTVVVSMPPSPADYAARLYAALHELEDAKVERIVVDCPPDSEPWWAVVDRLTRAASG